MKKSFLLAAFAGILLAGCTSDEQTEVATSRTDNPIVFNSPIVNAQTRVAQPGEQVGQYNTSESFHVYGVWSESNLVSWGAATPYMDTDVNYKENSTTDIKQNYWASDVTYYWPKDGKLSFAAYSPADCSGAKSYEATGLKIENFVIEETTANQYDLMYSERSLNRTYSSQLGSSVTPTYTGVDIQFKHALSSIKFLARTREDYSNTTIRIKKIEIGGTYYKGTFNETVTDGASYTSSPSWNVDNDIITTNYVAYEDVTGKEITNSNQPVQSNDVILLPQDLPNEAQFTITYTIQSHGSIEIPQIATQTIKVLT
ncbi:MAG: fimbrillin family protein, partial [Bacteroidaceae bacterium]|nr:fimbrillin family protein [Bacteroidaceae bacterium]